MGHVILTSNPFVFFVALIVVLYLIRPEWLDDLFYTEKIDAIALLIGALFLIVLVGVFGLYMLAMQPMDTAQSDIAQSSVSAVVGQSGQ